MIKIVHTHENGTLVEGTSRGDPALPILKANGFRWFHAIGVWGLRGSRDHDARQYVIECTVRSLNKAGIECEVQIDNTMRAIKDREADRAERLEARQDALEAKGERLEAKGDALLSQGRQMLDVIPFGQPMMPGHYSYSRDRHYRDRSYNKISRGMETLQAGQSAAGHAEASRRHRERRESGPVTLRRIDRFEAEVRDLDRRLEKYGSTASPEWIDRVSVRRRELQTDIAYWRDHLKQLEESGEYTVPNPGKYRKNDRIVTVWGEATVVRANPKTLTVTLPPPQVAGEHRIGYDKVKSHVAAANS